MAQHHERIEIDGQPTRLARDGTGEPVLLLHGWGGRLESMAPVAACLKDSFEVISLDLPGFGEAPTPSATWGTAEYARFVEGAIDRLGLDRPRVVGHSYGAKTALFLAARRPELVSKLVLVGSSGLRSAPSLRTRAKRGISRAARSVGKLGPPGRRLKDALFARIASDDYRQAGEMRGILVKVVNEDLTEMLPLVQAPTLLVWGARDDSVPVAHARTMERLIPDAGLVIFERAGHFAYLDEPDRFCRIVRHFFGEEPSS